jgi:hypothetical protein
VEAPDWELRPRQCGAGLHGLLWGVGDLGLLSADHDARYMLLSVDPADGLIELDDAKVQVPPRQRRLRRPVGRGVRRSA